MQVHRIQEVTSGRVSQSANGLLHKKLAYSATYLILLLILGIFVAFQFNYMSIDNANIALTALVSLFLLSFPFSYMLKKGMKLSDIMDSLGLAKKHFTIGNALLGIYLFIILLVLEIGVGVISQITNTQINTNVSGLFASAPIWFYLFLAIVGPIDEEVFFRGFLVPRLGILISALLFGILHAGYDSSFGIEIIAAFIFGLLAGYVFKRTKSLYPSIIAHVLVNSLTLLTTFLILVRI